MQKTHTEAPAVFNYDSHARELSERFNRLIKQLGPLNKKGTLRYNFEVDFTYAMDEVTRCPPYLQGKMFDKASSVVNALVNHLKIQQDGKEAQ